MWKIWRCILSIKKSNNKTVAIKIVKIGKKKKKKELKKKKKKKKEKKKKKKE